MQLLYVLSLLFFRINLILCRQSSVNSAAEALLDGFADTYWSGSNWKGASSWTGDIASRLMVNHLAFLQYEDHRDRVDNVFIKIVSRSLSRWTILQYLTQGYDDFGWTIFCLLDILRYTYLYEERYPKSDVVDRLPVLRNRVAFRAAFLHDIMEDSWSPELCGGGAEWKVRGRKLSLWPSLDFGGVYKNSITNHLYNSNNAQIYNASLERPRPTEITEVSLYYLRWGWKLIRPAFGWPRSHIKPFDFADEEFIQRAKAGLQWMAQAQLLTNDSLYMDGQRLRFSQSSPTEPLKVTCDATVQGIYTYNQVASIRAQRYMSRATGDAELIEEGHKAIRTLITSSYSGELGWNGILEDTCDRFSNCTQDMQIFKGLPFLDIKNYCEPVDWLDRDVQVTHRRNCSTYQPWIDANAAAAYGTVDQSNRFSCYWGSNSTVIDQINPVRSIETQVAGLSVLLTALWFNEQFNSTDS